MEISDKFIIGLFVRISDSFGQISYFEPEDDLFGYLELIRILRFSFSKN